MIHGIVNISSAYGLLPYGAKPLPEPIEYSKTYSAYHYFMT